MQTGLCIYCKNTEAEFAKELVELSSGYHFPCDFCSRLERIGKTYQMGLRDYIKLLDKQNGCCAICLIKFTSKTLPVTDHCHERGHVRGVLCSSCNMGLGFFKDSKESLERAITYLKSRSSSSKKTHRVRY